MTSPHLVNFFYQKLRKVWPIRNPKTRQRYAPPFFSLSAENLRRGGGGGCTLSGRRIKLCICSKKHLLHICAKFGSSGAPINPRPYRGGGWCNPPWGFSRIAKKRRRVAPPGFRLPYGANLPQFLAKKIWPGQVRSRSYDVIRGTTSGNFSNKVVFSRNLTWRHWCKW